ncbi:hypothetical protein, partial [Flavobacterium aquariorum]
MFYIFYQLVFYNFISSILRIILVMLPNVPALGEVAKFVTDYFLLKIKFLAKLKGDFYYKIRNLAKRML